MLEEEVVIKVVGKLSLEFPEIDQHKVREILYEVLNIYEITSRETSLVATDIPERLTMYLAVKRLDGLSKKTLYNYKLHLERFAQHVIKPLGIITTTDIRLYLAALVRFSNIKQTSLCTEISVLKSFFGWLENEEIIPKDPTKKIKMPKTEKRLRKALNAEELERLRDACKTLRQRALLEFLFSTGCRLSEVSGVKIDEINFENFSLKVIGKGNKERVVYFSPKARLYIKKYIASRLDTAAALFVSERQPHGRLGNRAIEVEINKIARYANFDKSIFPHLLRHTMATLALKSGASLTTIQKILGHEDPATTEIYAEIDGNTVRSEYEKYLNQ